MNQYVKDYIQLNGYPGLLLLEDWDYDDSALSATYIDKKSGFTMKLKEYRYQGEQFEDILIVINALKPEAYFYLLNEARKNSNITAYISQVFGTTSDYVLVYDKFGEDCLYDENYLKLIFAQESGYKYRSVKCGKIEKIKF